MSEFLAADSPPAPEGRLRQYIVAILAGVLSVLIRASLEPILLDDNPFIMAMFAVIAVAWYAGFWPALVTLAVSVLSIAYFILPPQDSMIIQGLSHQLGIALFVFLGFGCALLGESQRRAKQRAEENYHQLLQKHAQLETEVLRRQRVEDELRSTNQTLLATQRQTGEALALLDTFVMNAPVGLAFLDRDLRFVRVNNRLASDNAQPIAAHLGKTIAEALPGFSTRLSEDVREVLASGEARVEQTFLGVPAGRLDEPVTWNISLYPVSLQGGNVFGVGVVEQDITDRLRAERAVRESEERYRTLLESTGEGIYGIDTTGCCTFVNRAALDMLGRQHEDLLGRSMHNLIHYRHPDGTPYPQEECPILSSVQSGRSCRATDEVYWRGDGSAFFVEYSAHPIMQNGESAGGVVAFSDITERRKREELILSVSARLKAIVETAVDGILTFDDTGMINTFNPAAERAFGYKESELTGQPLGLLLPEPYRSEYDRDLSEYRRSGKRKILAVARELQGLRKDGTAFPMELSLGETPLLDRRTFTGIVRDITERKRSEQSLRENRERLKAALAASGTGTFRWFIQSGQLEWDEELGRLFGLPTGQTVRTLDQFLGMIHPEDRAGVIARSALCARDGVDFEMDYRVVWPNGTVRWLAERGKTVFGDNSRPAYMLGACADVTERVRMQDALSESESRFRTLAEVVPQLVWSSDAEGRMEYFNSRWHRYSGLKVEDSLGNGWIATVHPEDAARTVELWQDSIRTGEPYEAEYRLRGGDGHYRWFLARAFPQRDAAGRVLRWFGTSTDVDDQIRAHQELAESREGFRQLTEAVPQIVWTSNMRGEIDYFNGRWFDYTAMPPDRSRGLGWLSVVHPDDRPGVVASWEFSRGRSNRHVVEYRLFHAPENEYRWHLSSALPVHGADGAVIQWVGTLTDIDAHRRESERLEHLVRERTGELAQSVAALQQEIEERRRAELKEQAAVAELRRSNEELEKFAYVASHDLQEPLRKIQTFGDRLQNAASDTLSDQARDYLLRILASTVRMRQLISDLLTFARVTTKGQPFTRVDLSGLLGEVLSDLEVSIQQVEGKVIIGDLPTLEADPLQMRQLFQNLIGNALKFHKPGVSPVITVYAEAAELPAEGNNPSLPAWCISIADNGIGFDEKYLDRIFQVFQRLHGRTEYEGTGVGLAICRKIVERHSGSMTAMSVPGEGATFLVVLPEVQTRNYPGGL